MSYIYGAPILDVSRSHTTTQHSGYNSSGRVISSSQRPLPNNTRHSQQTNIHAPGGIRTNDFSRWAACGIILRCTAYQISRFNNVRYFQLCLGLLSDLFLSGSPTKTQHAFLPSPIRAIWRAHIFSVRHVWRTINKELYYIESARNIEVYCLTTPRDSTSGYGRFERTY